MWMERADFDLAEELKKTSGKTRRIFDARPK